MKNYLMALDQGTTSSRCVIFDKQGNIISMAQKELTQIYPHAGWVEHDPMEIWSTQLSTATEAMARAGLHYRDIAAAGITNQRETTIVWDKTSGKPLCNAIVWQCRRTSEFCDTLRQSPFGDILRQKTGLVCDAYFSATKIKWILDNVPGARSLAENGKLLFGTVDSWLLWNLTGGKVHATDYSNASRTMLFNIHELCWDAHILCELDIPHSMLPSVECSSHIFGHISREFFGGEIPIGGIAGDQQAALFGQCCFEPGMVKNTYGTGCFILINTGGKDIESENGLLTTIAWKIGDDIHYALEGSVFSAGCAIQWLRDGLRIIDTAAESEKFALDADDNGGVYFVPAFTGLGAPHWDQYARGAMFGITRGINRGHFIRAVLESIAYQSYDVIKAMESDAGIPLKEIRVDGGACANNFLMQFQADILGAALVRPAVAESTALGAAYLAGLAVGLYANQADIIQNSKHERIFAPDMSDDQRQHLIRGWRDAVSRSLGWAK